MLNILINEVLSTPSILIGLFVFLGNILLKSSTTDIISSTFRTIIGFTLLSLGAGIAGDTLNNFSMMFTEAFGLQAAVMHTDAYGALLNEQYSLAPIIMIVGMVLNLIIAKYTRFKNIYLSGHLVLYMAAMIAMILNDFHPILVIIIGSILLAFYMSLSPYILNRYTEAIVELDEFSVGNSGSLSFWFAAKFGEKYGDKKQSTEDIDVPQALGFLRDPAVSMSLTMAFLFIFISLFTGSAFIETNLSNGQNYIFYSFMQGIIFASGIQILITGINMAIDKLVEAFRGIAEHFINGAIPSLDAPVMALYSPNAMIIGFLSSLSGGVIGMILLTFTNLPIIIPGMLQHFFIGGISATYANSTGGRKAATIAPLLNGLTMAFLPAIFLVFVDGDVSSPLVFGDTDFTIIGILLEAIIRLFR